VQHKTGASSSVERKEVVLEAGRSSSSKTNRRFIAVAAAAARGWDGCQFPHRRSQLRASSLSWAARRRACLKVHSSIIARLIN